MIHREKNDLLHKDTTYVLPTASGRVNSLVIESVTGRKQAQDPPGSLHANVASVE